MERRTFLSTVALGAGAAGAGAIWLRAAQRRAPPPWRAHQIDDLLGRLERGVGRVRAAPHGGSVADRVIRVGLEALVVADVARSIPAGTHVPPALADALSRSVPVLDDCVVAYHALLEEAPRTMRRKLDQTFRAKPEMAMDVAEQIDEHASEIGISTDSRVRLRRVATNVGARVRRQSSSAIIDDCVAKMENVVARGGADLHAARSMTATALSAGRLAAARRDGHARRRHAGLAAGGRRDGPRRAGAAPGNDGSRAAARGVAGAAGGGSPGRSAARHGEPRRPGAGGGGRDARSRPGRLPGSAGSSASGRRASGRSWWPPRRPASR
ncbi:MAG: hypothetical protein M5U28_04835 [Sandaracinaceae bacterium]|nr:hypothetical protein [Sandaracinaceae bacterium]